MANADLLLHPVRLRVVKAFLGHRELTAGQLAAELPDVPAGSIYRHVALLTEAGILEVVAQRRVRATVERTYAIRLDAARIGPRELTADGFAAAFLAYLGGLLGDLDRYVATGPPDPVADGAGFRVGAMWLTDDELAEYLGELAAITERRLANQPEAGRRRRMLYTVMLPTQEEPK